MKLLSLATAASLASAVYAKTVYVTRVHYVTVEADGDPVGTDVEILSAATAAADVVVVTVGGEATSSTAAPTTLVTVAASFATISSSVETAVEATSQTAAATTASSTTAAATTTTSSSGIYAEIDSSGVDSSFATAILDAHNAKRALHSADDLSWSSTLYSYAQSYADDYTCGGTLVHSGGKYGENLAVGYASAASAVEAWYSEGSDYDYSALNVLDHFTEVIWKSVTELGCAYKTCGSGLYVICEYNPAGNVIGEESANLSSS